MRGLEDQLRPVAMQIVLDFIWTTVRKELKRRLLVLDEAWYLMQYKDSASFVQGVAKRARKYYLALTTATQDVQDFLSTDYGKAVLSNSSIQILLKQSPTEIDLVANIFYLTEQEKQLLLSSGVGEGLFFAGQSHVAIKVLSAPFEHELITSNPQELLQREQENQLSGQEVPAAPATSPQPAPQDQAVLSGPENTQDLQTSQFDSEVNPSEQPAVQQNPNLTNPNLN